MNKEYNGALQDKLRAYLTDNAMSLAKASPLIGLSKTTISQYLNSKYDNGDVTETECKLGEFFRLQSEKAASAEKAMPYQYVQGYVPTKVSESAYKLIRYCQLKKGITIIAGDAGIGKSMAAGKFLQDNPNSAVYVEVSPTSSTIRGFLQLLAHELKIAENQSSRMLSAQIKEKLVSSGKVLIVDEAQHMKYLTLEEIRTWSDAGVNGRPSIGLVLMGNHEVYDRMGGRQQAQFAQQFTRNRMSGHYRAIQDVTREDINLLFPYLVEKRMERELKYLLSIAQSVHGIRRACYVYEEASENEDVSYQGLLLMAQAKGIAILG